ncbi:MAG: enoyl-CoA hydratase [Lachnospiraceae bacterium]|nr:enoyl-CoA hydratase [Lachnospiraceae bacterium]
MSENVNQAAEVVEEQPVLYEQTPEGIGIITLNRPKSLNAITDPMRHALLDLVRRIATDDAVRAVIITGAGRAFCAGGDVKQMSSARSGFEISKRMKSFMHNVVKTIWSMEKPVIAAVNGYAVGAGANLALSCDFVITSETAKFNQTFVNIGLAPDTGGLYFLPKLVGLPKAKELMLLGKPIDGVEAARIGMVYKAVPQEEVMNEAMALATRFTEMAPKAIGYTKLMLNRSMDMNFEQTLDLEVAMQASLIMSEDHREGARAFAEKRKPVFQGK